MKIIAAALAIVLIVIAGFFLLGYGKVSPVCNPPQLLVEDKCCLDANNNKMCDELEPPAPPSDQGMKTLQMVGCQAEQQAIKVRNPNSKAMESTSFQVFNTTNGYETIFTVPALGPLEYADIVMNNGLIRGTHKAVATGFQDLVFECI